MLRIGLFATSLFALISCSTTPSDSAVQSTSKIEQNGFALHQALLSGDATDELTSREADLVEMVSDSLLCEGEYMAVSVDDQTSQLERLYLILQPARDQGMQVGRHVRFDFVLGTNDLVEITPSSKACLLIPLEEASSEAAFVTHLLSDQPTDFHVYLSLFHDQSLYVSTSKGLWLVQNGKISFVE